MATLPLKGLRFPFTISSSRGNALSGEEVKQIESDLLMLLVTEPGSRPFRRDYGIGISLLLQEPNDDILQALAKRRIVEGIVMFEPRIILTNIDFKATNEILTITLGYELQSNGQNITSDFNFNR